MNKKLIDIMKDTLILMQQTYIMLLQQQIKNRKILDKLAAMSKEK